MGRQPVMPNEVKHLPRPFCDRRFLAAPERYIVYDADASRTALGMPQNDVLVVAYMAFGRYPDRSLGDLMERWAQRRVTPRC